jgi:hypothetical protein
MNTEQPEWLNSGRGVPPQKTWAFATDAPLADVQVARETGETLAGDVLGGLYRLDRNGRVTAMTRGFKHLRALAWCDTAAFGAAILDSDQLCRFDHHLHVQWTMQFPAEIHAVAGDPFGHFLAVALENCQTLIIADDRQIVCRFPSIRPLHFLRFLVADRDLIGVANYGVIQKQHMSGEPVWQESVLSTVGDVAITGDGRLSYLASFSHGIQVYDAEGYNHASYVVNGSPSRLSTSFDGSVILTATQENFLYRLNPQGQLLWAAEAPEPVLGLHSDPLGQGFVGGFESGRVARFDWPE